MPTDNKKIGAYLPDVVFYRFTQFQKEHNLSASKAVIQIFTDYFGINLNSSIPNESTSELLGRVEILEKELTDLKNSFAMFSNKVDSDQSTSELPITESIEVSVDRDLSSELDSKLHSKPYTDSSVEQSTDIADKSESSSESESPKQLQLINSTDLLSELKSNPLQAKILATRLKVSPSEISSNKPKLSSASFDEFYAWLQSKDIDGIKWVIVGKGNKARYIPADDTPVEKLQALKNWLKTNS
jgi:hypothetical protein